MSNFGDSSGRRRIVLRLLSMEQQVHKARAYLLGRPDYGKAGFVKEEARQLDLLRDVLPSRAALEANVLAQEFKMDFDPEVLNRGFSEYASGISGIFGRLKERIVDNRGSGSYISLTSKEWDEHAASVKTVVEKGSSRLVMPLRCLAYRLEEESLKLPPDVSFPPHLHSRRLAEAAKMLINFLMVF